MMKKKIAVLAVTAMMAGMLTGCGKNAAYLSELKASDYVTLGEYKGVEVTTEEPEVTDEAVDFYIDYIMSSDAETTEVTDRAVKEGDTVNIDYSGYRDGVAFEGGTAQGQDLVIGSGSFIAGFEEGLIGANIGDEVSLDLTFPEGYRNEELAGAAVTFEVKVNSISVVTTPELTDEYVQGLEMEGCTTVEDFRKSVSDMLYASALSTYNRNLKADITDSVMANCVFKEVPEKMVDRYYEVIIDSMETAAAAYNMDLNTYIQNYYNLDAETYPTEFRNQAVTMAQQYIMFQAIADTEGLNMTEEEVNQFIEQDAATYGYETADEFKENTDMGTYEEYLMADKVMAFLIDNSVTTTTIAD